MRPTLMSTRPARPAALRCIGMLRPSLTKWQHFADPTALVTFGTLAFPAIPSNPASLGATRNCFPRMTGCMHQNRHTAIRALLVGIMAVAVAIPTLAFAAPRTAPKAIAPLSAAVDLTDSLGSVVIAPEPPPGLRVSSLEETSAHVVFFDATVTDAVATTNELARGIGFAPTFIYRFPIAGFAAPLSAAAVAALGADSRVASVTIDRIIPLADTSTLNTGVLRIGTMRNATAQINNVDMGVGERIDADVAIIDTGVDASHPDLNVHRIIDCTNSGRPRVDSTGHATHVAGIAGALDNGIGPVGVAPGVRIWSIKVGVASGIAYSAEICGLNAALEFADQIDVVNMSFGGSASDGACTSAADHNLMCMLHAAGVTLIAAAGNSGRDAFTTVPATYSEVIAVSAIVDTDGRIGGLGRGTLYGADDTFATYSNFGADVDIAAPGTEIESTAPLSLSATGRAVMTGTSMAAPHVAGAAALYISQYGRVGPAKVKAALLANSDRSRIANDLDTSREPMLYIGAIAPSGAMTATSGFVATTLTATCTGFRSNESIQARWDNGRVLQTVTANDSGTCILPLKIPAATGGAHTVVLYGKTSGRKAILTFTVRPNIAYSPRSGAPGTSIAVTLTGYAANDTITVSLVSPTGGTHILTTSLNATSVGVGTHTFAVPNIAAGPWRIVSRGTTRLATSRTFTVLQASPTPTTTASPSATAPPSPTPTGTTPSTATASLPTEPPMPTATDLPLPTATEELPSPTLDDPTPLAQPTPPAET